VWKSTSGAGWEQFCIGQLGLGVLAGFDLDPGIRCFATR
jgi:hypothetical protein